MAEGHEHSSKKHSWKDEYARARVKVIDLEWRSLIQSHNEAVSRRAKTYAPPCSPSCKSQVSILVYPAFRPAEAGNVINIL